MRRALVIDDSRTIRSILGKKLSQLGFKVSDAENGKVGLDTLRANPAISLVLVDWNMPVMNGLQFVQAVRAESCWNDVTIVMVTTETETSQMLAALDSGANDYIMKPFTEEIISERLMLLGFQEQTI
jgi:two-component system chemotaxis response regulator CheY